MTCSSGKLILCRWFALLALMFAGISPLEAQAAPSEKHAHDGIWWQQKSDSVRTGFVMGYLTASRDGRINGIVPHTGVDYESSTVWVAGLNRFYDDFRNRSIYIGDAIQYVRAQLNGATDDQLAAQITRLRQMPPYQKQPE